MQARDFSDQPYVPLQEHSHILRGMAVIAIAGMVLFSLSMLIADFVVPDHNWVSDTISDLGAGRYEFIVDAGIYSYAAALIACAVGAAHAHLGGRGWTTGIYGLILAGLIVFLVGARDEYGDSDSEGVVIHTYLVWGLWVLFSVVPWAMSAGAGVVSRRLELTCKAVTVLWLPLAPVFFFMPDNIDGLYERGLGALTFVFVAAIALTFLGRAKAIDA